MEFVVRLAVPEDLLMLADIESAAAGLFARHGFAALIDGIVDSPRDFAAAQAEGLLWVAELAGHPVAFALVEATADGWHLEELDVHPDHGRKGIGAALVRAVCAAATARGQHAVTLCTFHAVPWNAPFYARLGFCALPPSELSPTLRTRLREEAHRGLAAEHRVAMRWNWNQPQFDR